MKDPHKWKLEPELCKFLENVANELGVNDLKLFTEHKRNSQIFRATPRFHDKPWRDWVMVNWGEAEILPAQIWIFVDLQEIPDNLVYEPGTYAVIESAEVRKNHAEIELSDMFVPYLKETNAKIDGTLQRKFYFVEVDSFHAPTCMIPDFGNPSDRAYLRLTPRSEWASQFGEWLGTEHLREFPRN
jgi:hypothetical protein